MEIKTPRLTLTPVHQDHAPEIFRILSSYQFITLYLPFTAPKKIEETQDFIAHAQKEHHQNTGLHWAMIKNETLIGVIGLSNITGNRLAWRMDNATIGYWLNPEYNRQGFVSEAVEAVLDYAFSTRNLHKIIAGHVADNTPSEGLLKKAGFTLVGTHKKHYFDAHRWWDYTLWEKINPKTM